jgi:hypothetical protein
MKHSVVTKVRSTKNAQEQLQMLRISRCKKKTTKKPKKNTKQHLPKYNNN